MVVRCLTASAQFPQILVGMHAAKRRPVQGFIPDPIGSWTVTRQLNEIERQLLVLQLLTPALNQRSHLGLPVVWSSNPDTDWYPHYIHNMDNLIRFGGLFPPIDVHADTRRTRLLGVTHIPKEGGCMMVRAKDDIYRMNELKGKKIGLSKSMNQIKNDWWRIQEHMQIELMLRVNGMTMDDIELVEFSYADDWYNNPEMLIP